MSTVEQEIITGYTYQLMRGDEDALNLENRVLQDGEPVVVNRKDGSVSLKVGDGVTAFKGLPYVSFDADALSAEVTETALDRVRDYMTEKLGQYVSTTTLQTILGSYATIGSLDSYVKTIDFNREMNNFAKVEDLDSYCTVNEFDTAIANIPGVSPIPAQTLAEIFVKGDE